MAGCISPYSPPYCGASISWTASSACNFSVPPVLIGTVRLSIRLASAARAECSAPMPRILGLHTLPRAPKAVGQVKARPVSPLSCSSLKNALIKS
jgi:hypothetical protein